MRVDHYSRPTWRIGSAVPKTTRQLIQPKIGAAALVHMSADEPRNVRHPLLLPVGGGAEANMELWSVGVVKVHLSWTTVHSKYYSSRNTSRRRKKTTLA